MLDELAVPFALAAGLSGAVNTSFVVLVAGIAEKWQLGSMAMGLGGYLAARSETDTYTSKFAREHAEVRTMLEAEAQEIRDIFRGYGLEGVALTMPVCWTSRWPTSGDTAPPAGDVDHCREHWRAMPRLVYAQFANCLCGLTVLLA